MLSCRLLLCRQREKFWTLRLPNENINVPSGDQSSAWLVWKQRKEKLKPPKEFYVHNTLLKSNVPVLCAALNYILNWQSFPHCCCCANRHFLRRPLNCREVTHIAYYQLLTLYNDCIAVRRVMLQPSKPPGSNGLETKPSTLQRFEWFAHNSALSYVKIHTVVSGAGS